MMFTLWSRFLLILSFYCICEGLPSRIELEQDASIYMPPDIGTEFWKRSIIYQIYPRSFYDSNGDGIGDLRGIASRTNYFVDLGVETIWLSPIYKSPMKDFGYDISDFKDVDPIFGTLDDFDFLLKQMHDKGIKVLLDFVPNHTSDKHDWFQKSLKNDPKYKDYYVWKDPAGYNETGYPIPPNNWLSSFRYSAWEWSDDRKQFYLHQFLKEQPDLNFRNPNVVNDMKDVLRFWLDKGVNGFRVDAVKHLIEVDDVYGRDEPVSTDSIVTDPTEYDYLNHTYTANQPETMTVVHGWKQVLEQYGDTVMMLEVYDDNIEAVMSYYGNDTYRLSDFPFNFLFITQLSNRTDVTGTKLKNIVNLWLSNMPMGMWPNWVLGNHDRGRVGSRLGTDLIDAMNMLTLLLPGTPITYYGEEIGMENAFVSFEETQDPAGLHMGPEHYLETSRDPERTPMQWNDSPFAGFTQGNTTWLKVNDNYSMLNVESERHSGQSHLNVYKELATLRQETSFLSGELEFQLVTENTLAFIRSYKNVSKYIIVINTSEEETTIDITEGKLKLLASAEVLIRSCTDNRTETDVGSSVNLSKLTLIGGEGIVLRMDDTVEE